MDTIWEIQDMAYGYKGCIFCAMFIIVMIVGPWGLIKQLGNAGVHYSIKKSMLVSLFAGLMSILLFYLFFLKFVVKGAETRIPVLLLFLIYLPMLHICVLYLAKFKGPKHLSSWTGWHLTLMTGVFTFLFSFLVSSVICNAIMQVEAKYYFEKISAGIADYHQKNEQYPPDMKALFDAKFPPVWYIQNNSILWQYKPAKNENNNSRDYYHFLPLPENAPKGLVWMWVDAQLVESSKMPVMFFDGKTRIIQKKEFDSLVERSQKWLAENPQTENISVKKDVEK